MTPKLALFLRGYRAEREDLYQQLGKSLSLDDLVFASVEGKPIDPCALCPVPSIEWQHRPDWRTSASMTCGIPSPVLCYCVGQNLK